MQDANNVWSMFEKSGNIQLYILYKELLEEDEEKNEQCKV